MGRLPLLRLTLVLLGLGVVSGRLSHGQGTSRLPSVLDSVIQPANNPNTETKVALGRVLFFDGRLSRNNRIACATCHHPNHGFADGKRLAIGIDGQRGSRHTPSLINVGYSNLLFWDGRVATLEEQALHPIQNPKEMDQSLKPLLEKLNRIPEYRERFVKAFAGPATAERVAQALAAYQRTLVSKQTPFDRYLAGHRDALSGPPLQGMQLFFGRARCSVCHTGAILSDQRFHNIGTADPEVPPDEGRRAVTHRIGDMGAFRTPQLREVGRTAPYMHNGRFQTLTQVVQHYNFGGVTDQANEHRDSELEVLYLSEAEVEALVAFLEKGLTTPTQAHPARPPE